MLIYRNWKERAWNPSPVEDNRSEMLLLDSQYVCKRMLQIVYPHLASEVDSWKDRITNLFGPSVSVIGRDLTSILSD
jgi:hypothetical protein